MVHEGGLFAMEPHVSKSAEEWRETTARQARERTAERQKEFVTSIHIEVPDLASEEDLQDFDAHDKLCYRGEFPFTRGIHPGMIRSRLWALRQSSGFGTAEGSDKC